MNGRIAGFVLTVVGIPLLIGVQEARAQTAYGYSTISITASGVYSTSMTDLDYLAQAYYSVETDGYLWVGNSVNAHGSVYASGSYLNLYVPTSISTNYWIQTNHWVVPVASGSVPDFSCVKSAFYSGSFSVAACGSTTSPTSVYIGTSSASGNTNSSPPSISGVDQTTYGTAQAGTSGYVILYGSNLATPYGATTVSIGDNIISSLAYTDQNQLNISYTIPANAATGAQTLTVWTPYGSASTTFLVYGPPSAPSITAVSPNPAASGVPVTITGTNFGATQGSSTVTFGGVAATVSSWSGTSIVALVPAAATSGAIVVTVSGIASPGFAFQVVQPVLPYITGIAPQSGPVGSSVTITGTNFGATPGKVSFNGEKALVNWGQTSIQAIVPPGATSGNVVVSTSVGSSNPVAFAVTPLITGLSPSTGPVQMGFVVSGTSFGTAQGTLTLNGVTFKVCDSCWTDTAITVQVPAGATTGPVQVQIGNAQSNADKTFTVSQPFGCGQ